MNDADLARIKRVEEHNKLPRNLKRHVITICEPLEHDLVVASSAVQVWPKRGYARRTKCNQQVVLTKLNYFMKQNCFG